MGRVSECSVNSQAFISKFKGKKDLVKYWVDPNSANFLSPFVRDFAWWRAPAQVDRHSDAFVCSRWRSYGYVL